MAFEILLSLLMFTWGYIACIQHAAFLDKREAKRRSSTVAPPGLEDQSNDKPFTILNYDRV